MSYQHQLLINILTGAGDSTITDGSQRIVQKGNSKNIKSSVRLYPALGNFSDEQGIINDIASAMHPWRLYIRGHGSWKNRTVGGVNGATLASRLAAWGLGANVPDIISVTGCRAAKDQNESAQQMSLQISTNSFVADFHWALRLNHGIATVVYGRTMKVNTSQAVSHGYSTGTKLTRNPVTNTLFRHQQNSKVKFFWQGPSQMTEWVCYSDPMEVDGGDDMDVDETPSDMDIS